ncbi:MAG: hypothetical protein KGI59_00615 [Patescibacteria group bacterium]|nr:hypothetical protein [Patescibacteria group bacterium]MDE2172416.1 hypothetical protein [Patescibacteria group bacterium]
MEITDIAAIIWISAVLNVALGAFVYSASKKRSSTYFLIAVLTHAVWVTIIGFYISVRSIDTATLLVRTAYFAGMLVAGTYSYFFLTYPDNKRTYTIFRVVYPIVIVIFGYLIFATDLVISRSYYIGGIAYWGWSSGPFWYVFPFLFFSIFLSGFAILLYNGIRSLDRNVRQSSLLVFWGVTVLITIPTVMNVILPQFGIFTFIWLGPILNMGWIGFIAYAIVKHEALDVRLIATRAFGYAVAVVGVGMLTIGINILTTFLTEYYPDFPGWFMPIISAFIIVTAAYGVWLKIREGDVLKYEFITVATHKFRTPLTHIKWAAENLHNAVTPVERETQLKYIENANAKLVELTNILVNISDTDNNDFQKTEEKSDIAEFAADIISSLTQQLALKHIVLKQELVPGLRVMCNPPRVRFVMQTFLENAVNYTPDGGSVTVSVRRSGTDVIYAVRDSGIGIARNELALLFTKFYRGHHARLADTEGLGIGLYISKQIIESSRGRISAESDGEGKGSTFSFSLPIVAS